MMKSDKAGYGNPKSGNQRHAPGTAAGESSLSSAVGELNRQHPHPYWDHGNQTQKSPPQPMPTSRKAVL